MGATKAKYRGGQLAYYDGSTYETVLPLSPVLFEDDFLGTAINGDVWTTLDILSATFTVPAASYWKASIGAADENAAAGIYGKDVKAFDIGKGLIYECRMAVHTAPTLTTEVGFGVMNDSYGVDSMRFMLADEVAKYAFFGFYTTVGAGLIPIIRTDDGTLDSTVVSTATTVVADAFHIYRMDFTDLAAVKFYIDGARVATATTFNMSTAASLLVQPWTMIYKHDDGTTSAAGEMWVDYVRIWQATR